PLHIWQSRAATIESPDFCVLDLDPKGAPLADVVTIALFLRELCDRIGLPSFVKTSGSTGLHVLVPLGRQLTFDQSRSIAHLLALIATRELGDIATVARLPSQREGKVYIDYVQNGPGRLIAAPYCVRPLPGAPVSTPLEWGELEVTLELGDHTIRTVPTRVGEGKDPMADLLTAEPDLPRALTRLEASEATGTAL
ncbi:MAG: DNA ligase, partial [Gemmatimonadetes bacterium]|nr:DNA ligase [Gemmatimonadota bacterium]